MVHGTPLGERLLEAILKEGRTVQPLEEELGVSKGHLGRIIRGERWGETVDVELAKRLAAVLHVNFLWLVLGEGPMRREGRPATNAEQAMAFARQNGAREDAVQAAWERNKDREDEMSVLDWVMAMQAEAYRLNAAGVARPEAVRQEQQAIQRISKKRRQRRDDASASPDPKVQSPKVGAA
jgi:transcriptional regulator with XRE-family HTH domain